MYFSTVPPSFSMSMRSWLNAAPRAALSRSGPRRTVCCVEPTTSMKRHATSRRSSRRSTRPEASPDASGCLRLALCLPQRRGDPLAREGVVLAPGIPHRAGPAAHRSGVLLRCGAGDVGDRDRSASARDGGLFDMTRARKPALDALVHLFRPVVLDRDGEASEVRGERTAGEDVPVVLARVAVDSEAPHRGVARILERAKADVFKEFLARLSAAGEGAALGTGLEVGGRASGASPP